MKRILAGLLLATAVPAADRSLFSEIGKIEASLSSIAGLKYWNSVFKKPSNRPTCGPKS
jgi:hypothetical protein